MLINVKDIHGEEGTGFEPRVVNGVDKGPFECGNCSFFKNNSCGQSEMIARGKKQGLALTKDGRRPVEEPDCCEFVDRTGKHFESDHDNKFDIKHATWLKKD
jgi:hypothetical protein